MRFDLDNLPSEPTHLQHLIRDMAAAVEHRDGEIERLKSIIKKLQRAQFGRRSERLDPDQLALALEEIDRDFACEEEKRPRDKKQAGERPSRRKPLPGHLSREEVRLDIESMICSCCGGALHVIGESVSEMLDWVPAQLRVIHSSQIRLPDLRDGGASASTRAADRRRIGDAGAACPGAGQQILRSHAAVLAVADLRPPRKPPRRIAAVGVESRKSCQELREVQNSEAYV
jgi:transposase